MENIIDYIVRNKVFLIFSLVIIAFGKVAGQSNHVTDTVAEEKLRVNASSATVFQWFRKIEEKKHIVLSYNSSVIDVSRTRRINFTGELTVKELLERILDEYEIRTIFIPPNKLVIQAREWNEYYLNGTVFEEGSGERLYGAVVTLENRHGKQWYVISDENGGFKACLPEGKYTYNVSYMGYPPYSGQLDINQDRFVQAYLQPQLFEIDEIKVKSDRKVGELSELNPSNMLAFSGNDLFSQIWILPGVTSSLAGNNFQVDGGGNDENLFLLDGVPVYHPGHFNSLLPVFNGDAVKNIIFHKGFFPTRLEGRLSSVTEVNLKEGNKQEQAYTMTLDVPAASIVLEGPIVKDKLSYMVSGRRSWLDFFDKLFSEEEQLNHSSFDGNAKLSYSMSPVTSLHALVYVARDDYHLPLDEDVKESVLRWDNRVYQLSCRTRLGNVGSNISLFYSSHVNRASVDIIGFGEGGYVHSGIKSANLSTEFTYSVDRVYQARWGMKLSREIYDVAAFGEDTRTRHVPINQFSVFYDNSLHVTSRLSVQVGVHGVGYYPRRNPSYYSIQPRLSVKYFPGDKDLFYLNFSKMEQFYHCLKLNYWDLPTDFRMPSIGDYKPRTSEHYESGWKHFLDNGLIEVSAYYKTRRNLVALRPETYVEDDQWQEYIMTGKGDSYGIRFYFNGAWERWRMQVSYSYARSREWFDELAENGKMSSLQDIPHQAGIAISYRLGLHSLISAGGMLHSGKILEMDDNFDPFPVPEFRTHRSPLNYRVDAGYSYRKSFGDKLLSLRFGLYNIIGNPSEEEILSYYSVHWKGHCLPYGSISFKF